MAKKPATPSAGKPPSVVVIDPTLLSDEVKDRLRAAAAERVHKEKVQAAEDDFLERVINEERRKGIPNEEMKYITLDMAGHSDRIMLDGVVYFHGQTYAVPKSTFDTMAEVVSRGWQHEDEVGGANRDVYRRPRNLTLRKGMEGVTSSNLLRSA